MNSFATIWTDQMRHALAALQHRPPLRRLLAYAEQCSVQLYAVGGTLRDICLERQAQDVDLAMMGDVMGFAQGLANHLRAAYVPMDPERGEARVVYRKRDVIDFARLKGDTISADLGHRDFTINAMACPLSTLLTQTTPALIDPHSGWHDMQVGVVRMVSPMSFQADPLRLLRAFRLAASLGFTIDPATLAAMSPITARLVDVAAERTHSELLKLFSAPHSSPHIVTMADLGLLDRLFPELATTHGILWQPGDRLDLFEYSIRTYQWVEELINTPGSHFSALMEDVMAYFKVEERQALVKWTALLHAIGGGVAHRATPQAHVTDPSIARQSARQWQEIGNRLKLSRKQIEYGMTLIAHHGRLWELAILEAQGRLTLRSVHGWCKEVGDDMLGVFVLALGCALASAQSATLVPGAIALEQFAARVWEMYRRRILPVINAPRLVTGHDLRQIFHLTPGPRFKMLLDELEVAQVEGRIYTRAQALQWVAEQLAQA
jgi:poly(A) polymerase